MTREEEEKLKEDEMKVDVDAPQGESAETQNSKKEGDSSRIRRSQDYVCGTLAISQEAVRYWQTASVVVEGGEAHTVNLCQQCYNEQMVQARQAEVEFVAMESSRGKEGTSWENEENYWT